MRSCRSCSSRIYPVFDLGKIVPSDFLRPDQPDPPAQPLTLCRCDECGLVQLADTADREKLFRQYWYRSGINETMRAEMRDIVEKAKAVVGGVGVQDRVLDIGANDGTLLNCYTDPKRMEPIRIAYEPAENLFTTLQQHANLVVPDFFPSPTRYRPAAKSIKIATSIAMFYDLDDPRAFVAEIDRILSDDGVWVVQFQDLAQMLQTRAFDNIVHEHLAYYSLESFDLLLNAFDLHIVDAEPRAINGGSLRLVVRRRKYDVTGRSVAWWSAEEPWRRPEALEKFAWEAGQVRSQLQDAIAAADRLGPIDLYAASTKSSTLLQYCGLDWKVLRQAAERTPEKVGLVTSATRIPIVNEHTWRADPAPTTVLGAWQFTDAFVQREAEYLAQGGTFLVPLPTMRVISHAHAPAAEV